MQWQTQITPSFRDTDALQHINNIAVAGWFEGARRGLFEIFTPDLDPNKWQLILAKIETEFKRQVYFQDDVIIKTYIKRIGNRSLTTQEELYQGDELCVVCNTTLVCFDHDQQKSKLIPNDIRAKLEQHLIK